MARFEPVVVRVVRLVALGLFGLTAAKLVLVDLAVLRQIYRIVSFLVIGLLMIGASYLYHRIERWMDSEAPASEEDEDDFDIGT